MGNKKQKVITEIFRICMEKNNFVFDNDLVKKVSKKYNFGNPFDVTNEDENDICSIKLLKNIQYNLKGI